MNGFHQPQNEHLAVAAGLAHPCETHLSDPILEAVHLHKHFPVRGIHLFKPQNFIYAVKDVSLALYPGRATALVGESGSGKTTVARMLAGLYNLTAGEILFRGEPTHLKGAANLRHYR